MTFLTLDFLHSSRNHRQQSQTQIDCDKQSNLVHGSAGVFDVRIRDRSF